MRPDAVFFDLDGTLADTAPDLADALNALRLEHGLPPLAESKLRPWTSNGTRGMLHSGFGVSPEQPDYRALADRYLQIYAASPFVRTTLFEGMDEVLAHLDEHRIAWGVVTNKPRNLAQRIMSGLQLEHRMACLVGGDCAEAPKPSPAPLLLACTRTGQDARTCLYVGDDQRDIMAGRAAGMRTVAAAYGYLGDSSSVVDWQADWAIDSPIALLGILAIG